MTQRWSSLNRIGAVAALMAPTAFRLPPQSATSNPASGQLGENHSVRAAPYLVDHFELYRRGIDYSWMPLEIDEGTITLLERVSAPGEDLSSRLTLRIDGHVAETSWTEGPIVTEAERNRCLNAGSAPNRTWIALFDPVRLSLGAHAIHVEMSRANGPRSTEPRTFYLDSQTVEVVERKNGLGAQRVGVVVANGGIRATARGSIVRMIDPNVPYQGRNKSVTPVVGMPAYDLSGEVPVLICALVSGRVVGLRADQDSRQFAWIYQAHAALFGSVLAADGVAYVGDAAGRMHAIDTSTHAARWVFDTHGSSIDARPTIAGELLVFGAWDGFVYAVDRRDGTLAWTKPGPRSSRSEGDPRYCAPVDCPPVALAERIFVCDRGYELAAYSLSGEMTRLEPASIAAIGPSEDGRHLNLRGTDDVLTRITLAGEIVWRTAVELGSFPVPPVEKNGVVYVCSDLGQVAWVDTQDGRLVATYQATPRAYVMAPLAVDDSGICWVAGMDGSLSGLKLRTPAGQQR